MNIQANKKNTIDKNLSEIQNLDDITVFTVPSNKPWILTKEESEDFLKKCRLED